ncbi:NAD(P)/FAD-dependent oxidoreductase [Curtobacterium sp. MCBD17_040]|uniref:flavin-containing monooxygenase n=1 Tax=Curtobacterium sp. MCBD17_040 TaxID=2175674 RepID=UPI001C64F94A|nr:NAD(P)/FAD-dependent oxidoreductase [Curtobacterium sp. MCBD17_040]WIB62519.1 NAD(P)/FAD-dependent oxidoreductase [Curtobacterium sp. MCBD17_040]
MTGPVAPSPSHTLPAVVDTVVVGAGIGGIAVASGLLRAGHRDLVVLERADDVGGTWRDNVYPGVACDIPARLYAFSFRPNPDWSRRFAPGAEIQAYLQGVARAEGVTPHVRFGTELLDARWHEGPEDAAGWVLTTSRGVVRCRSLVLAAGRLSEPRLPAVPGLDRFPGTVVHSSAWDPTTSVAGARVAVIGTGASAVQLVPHVAVEAARTVVFQRSAPYVVPRNDEAVPTTEREHAAADPAFLARERATLFDQAEAGHVARRAPGAARDALRRLALDHLAAQVPDPAMRRALTPDHEIGCKRVLLSDDYYPALASGRAVLESSALVAVDDTEAVADSGRRHPVDVIVLATGFAATDPPVARRVRGRDGLLLADHWGGGMTAWATTLVAGFPDLFVVDGPNAALGHNSAVDMIETQARFVVAVLRRARADGARTVEVDADAERRWTADLDAMAAGTVWLTGGCRSWYVDERSGRLTLLWPGTARAFRRTLERLATQPLPGRAA